MMGGGIGIISEGAGGGGGGGCSNQKNFPWGMDISWNNILGKNTRTHAQGDCSKGSGATSPFRVFPSCAGPQTFAL